MKETVLVVGGAGFIGSHTTLALSDAGFDVVIYDDFSAGHREACFGFEVVEGRLSDTERLIHLFRGRKIACVVNFAALIEAGQSVKDPYAFFQNNVGDTLGLLRAMQHCDVSRLVFSSTAAVYGNQDAGVLSEDLPVAPINPYGHSKAMIETVLRTGVEAYGLRAIALRYFNAAGADPQGRTGERHSPETHLIPLVIQAALGQRASIKVFGTDYDTPDGTCIRDYIHVSDLARGHVAAVRALLEQQEPGFQAMNLGTGTGQSVRAVIEAVKAASGVDFPVEIEARRPGDPARLVANPERAERALNWHAERSDLQTIVTDAWRYFSAAASQ